MRRALALLPLILLLSPVAHAAGSEKDKAAVKKRLSEGEVIIKLRKVRGSEIPGAVATGVIDAPPEKVWDVVEHCADYTRTMPHVAASEELERKGNRVICRVTVDVPLLPDLTSTTRCIHEVEPGKKYKRTWKLIEGDYVANHGSWTLVPFGDGRTLAVYEAHAEPKIRIPAPVQRMAVKRNIPELFEYVRKFSGAKPKE